MNTFIASARGKQKMKEIFAIVLNLSMLGFVAGSMVTLGLGLSIAQIITPFKKIRVVIRALIANFTFFCFFWGQCLLAILVVEKNGIYALYFPLVQV